MDKNENIRLSVLDIERKYIVDPDELTYGNMKMVTWGADNKLPTLYRNCYNQSASLKAIIDGTINYVLGDEVIVNESATMHPCSWKDKHFLQCVQRVLSILASGRMYKAPTGHSTSQASQLIQYVAL